jgi:hypothetical protein
VTASLALGLLDGVVRPNRRNFWRSRTINNLCSTEKPFVASGAERNLLITNHCGIFAGLGLQPQLRVIAQELLNSLKSSVTIDWAQREPARARIRVLVKRILRKYGYPPDLQDAAVQTVLQQAEVLSERWAA